MGNTIWIVFRRGTEVECTEEDHSIVCRMEHKLDRIAREQRVRPLSEFYDASEMAAEFGDYEKDSDGPFPEPVWYNPSDGLRSVQAILKSLSEIPELCSFPDDPTRAHCRADLIQELKDCESQLANAIAESVPFHFAIIM